MIDLSKCPETRARRNSVWVHGAEHGIRTEFWLWINYERMRERACRGADIPLEAFDRFYSGKPPGDRVAGIAELDKFAIPEQALPHPEHCVKSDVVAWDWIADGEYINAKFLEVYGIDLEMENDMHWHRFLGLFGAILIDINGIIGARQHKSEDERDGDDTYDRAMERQRDAWWISGTKPAKRAPRKKR